ncbi:MAG: ABC transporter permease [Candidatus Promineifilaceae bacterium]
MIRWFNQLTGAIWRAIVRTFAFISKEMRLILHQPRLVFSLILGPFLILLLFGIGYQESPRTLRTLFVVPQDSEIEEYVRAYAESLSPGIAFEGITDDADDADRQLRTRAVDLVVVTPGDPAVYWKNNEPARLSLYHFEIDPLESQYIQIIGQQYAQVINQELLRQAISEGQQEASKWHDELQRAKSHATTVRRALSAGNEAGAQRAAGDLQQDLSLLSVGMGSGLAILGALEQTTGETSMADTMLQQIDTIQSSVNEELSNPTNYSDLEGSVTSAAEVESSLEEVDKLLSSFQDMNPSVMVAPFESETLSIAQVALQPMYFYVPGVIALLLQHLAITLAGLSIVREKLGGAMELIRAAPASALEMLLGKYAGYLLLTGALALVLTGLIVWGLGVPQLGAWTAYIAIIIALLLASLGIGFHISLSARSNSQAIQYAMLILLASIFFSGFFMPLYRLITPVHIVSWTLPATYGTVLLQEVMLRGRTPSFLLLGTLFGIAGLLLIGAWVRLRRQLSAN